MAWIVVPPLLIVVVGLGSSAWLKRSEWRLRQTESLSDILPAFIEAQREARELIDGLVLDKEDQIGSEDRLISFLQEVAFRRGFTIDAVQVARREQAQDKEIPVLNAMVEGSGEFTDIQCYINEIKLSQQLLSVNSINLTQPRMQDQKGLFKARIVFDLLMVDEVLSTHEEAL